MSAPTVESDRTATATGDTLSHCYCLACRSGIAQCGYDLGPIPAGTRAPSSKPRCVVCTDLRNAPCPTCGHQP